MHVVKNAHFNITNECSNFIDMYKVYMYRYQNTIDDTSIIR